jgi:pyrimidine operon attenuation protein/uracil phosphoribosyltransferase
VDPDDIANTFPLDLDATKQIQVTTSNEEVWLYKVKNSRLIPKDAPVGTVYIVDTSAGGMVACPPHIVRDDLNTLCKEAANHFVNATKAMDVLTKDATILHILRAGAGYMVAEVMKEAPIVYVRTEYKTDGYRAHSDDSRRLVVSYRNYPQGLKEASTILVPDTYATGRSAETALLDIMNNGFKPDRIIIYGFIAIPALIRIGSLCERHGIDLQSFSICDLTQLAYNNYDMCIYGPDESLYKETCRKGMLGSIIDRATLQRLLPYYIPGLDQPGDWSERQNLLFDGVVNRSGDIKGHLIKSIRLIESLMEINAGEEWYTETHEAAVRAELELLKKQLMSYAKASGGSHKIDVP